MRGKMWVSKSRLVLVVRLIGWEDGVSFLDQSQSEVTQNQNIPEFFYSTLTLKSSFLYVTRATNHNPFYDEL